MGEQIYKIAEHYGFKSQSIMLIEEMAELTKAITKYKRYVEGGQQLSKPTHLAKLEADIGEEIADVEICLEQIKYLLKIDPMIDNLIKKRKIARTLNLIKEAEE